MAPLDAVYWEPLLASLHEQTLQITLCNGGRGSKENQA
jgi:hypothetical protein